MLQNNGWILYADASPGYHLIDVVFATVSKYILEKILLAWQEDQKPKRNAVIGKGK